jgi:hypothetical protein
MINARTFAPLCVGTILVFGAAWVSRSFTPAPRTPLVRTPLARLGGTAPPARVPAPKPTFAADLKIPCWGCSEAVAWPVRFRTDLDHLAPLGDGKANAAHWLANFTRNPKGARFGEYEAARKRFVPKSAEGDFLPGDDPLLLEAEPWADQGAMRFYPDVFPFEGFSTPIPNLHVAMVLARSWTARARANPDAPSALEDARRAIRWGRLLRQDDATIIQDLIGLACIRLGVETLYELAQRRGDRDLMLASAIVAGEHAVQRQRTSQFLTNGVLLSTEGSPRWVEPTDRQVDALARTALQDLDRRFRLEAIVQFALIRFRGTRGQRAKAQEVLEGIESRHRDEADVAQARWARTVRWPELSRSLD